MKPSFENLFIFTRHLPLHPGPGRGGSRHLLQLLRGEPKAFPGQPRLHVQGCCFAASIRFLQECSQY
ncbi:hypothetical protein CHARACLAT_016176 [Characodon lateralis]|uniref:Uncharacterized protein n=1 Tax=Characodon lateralis TaxID=208331 RepID=A0ABU7DHI5_9TELE|nr:hypothetical protein [Characodon lateralis]